MRWARASCSRGARGRQGQAVARNLLASHGWGASTPYAEVPFFWSNHFEIAISYVGHATAWDEVDVVGDLEAHDFAAACRSGGRTLAAATMGRDRTRSKEALLQRGDEAALARLVPRGSAS